jgi:hypothetical protein
MALDVLAKGGEIVFAPATDNYLAIPLTGKSFTVYSATIDVLLSNGLIATHETDDDGWVIALHLTGRGEKIAS